MKWTIPLLLLALAGCAPIDTPRPLTLTEQPPASTFQTPPPRATDYPLARPGATAQIRGTVTP